MSGIEDNKAKVRKMQQVILQIMCDIDDFCRKNDITYFLSGGTCLGAVRHQGFIPWDDDADLMMPRKDYERFLIAFAKEYEGKYQVGSVFTDETWQRPSAQVCDLHSRIVQKNLGYKPRGIFLDIFAIDGLPKSKWHQKWYYRKLKVMDGIRHTGIRTKFKEEEKYRLLKKTVALFTNKRGARGLAVKMDRYAAKFDFDTSPQVAASLPIHYGEKETIDKEHFAEVVYMPFEGKSFPVPKGYQTYLSNLYGNYMQIPEDAAEKGYSHLDFWEVEFLD